MTRITTLVIAAAVSVGVAAPAMAQDRITAAAPDLVPIASRMDHGVVAVRNVGSAAAGPSIVTLTRWSARGSC